MADPTVYILADLAACIPAPTACLGGADDNTAGVAETATYTNSTAAAVSVFIVVDGFYGTPYTFDLLTALQ
jgi:hypothetical protein